MMETNKEIRAYIRRFLTRMLSVAGMIWLIGYAIGEAEKKPPPPKRAPEEIWKGYDPTRPVTDISSVDFVKKQITYRVYRQPGEPSSPQESNAMEKKNPRGNGVVITTRNGKKINTGLTYEELFEQLHLEYEDLYEYYMD